MKTNPSGVTLGRGDRAIHVLGTLDRAIVVQIKLKEVPDHL